MTQKYTKPDAKTLKSFLFIIGLCTFYLGNAQTYIGLQHSNYGGIHQTNLNPANIANSVHKTYFNALTFGFGFNNDYVRLELPFTMMQVAKGQVPDKYHQEQNPNNRIAFQNDWLHERLNGKGKNANIYAQIKVPGFMMSLPKGFAVGFQYKNTISFQINDMAEPLAQLAVHGIDSSNGTKLYSGPNTYNVGDNFKDNAFTININTWGEWCGTIAKTLIKEDNMVLKFGFTGKYLVGYATGYVKNNGVEFHIQGDDSISFGPSDVEYGYSNTDMLENLQNLNASTLIQKQAGAGFGYDIGGTFEYNPAATKRVINKKTNYLFRAGISLLDGGSIHYKNKMHTTHITNKPNSGIKLGPDFAKAWANGSENGLKYTDSAVRSSFDVVNSTSDVKTKMPTTINLQFDYNVFKFFYVGANISQDMRGKQNIGVRRPSYLMIIPRIESKFIEVAMPIGLMNDYKAAQMGIYLRIGPIFFGSDNLIGQLKGKNVYGGDFYFGLSMGIPNKKDKDKSN